MSRFNQPTARNVPSKTVTNLAGGSAYSQSAELELASLLATSFVQDQYYRSANDGLERLRQLIQVCNKKFVAQTAIYMRKQFGMRSITHATAAELAKYIGGEPWAKNFYNTVVDRVDDMLEIASYYWANCAEVSDKAKKRKKKDLTGAMKKGFAMAFNRFTKYQLAKYRGGNKAVKLVDLVNLCHLKPSDENAEAIKALVAGDLKSFDTWESELSSAGQKGETDEDVKNLKADAWTKLLKEKKLGYLALLRNLRNIKEQAPAVLPFALAAMVDKAWIKKSRIFPFQFLIAYKQFLAESHTSKESRLIVDALSKAIDLSCENLKGLFEGEDTLVAVDNSGSMDAPVAKSEHMKRSELGALFGIVFAKGINGDIMEWASRARYIHYNLNTGSMGFAAEFHRLNQVDHGTDIDAIFNNAKKKYDRILIFSDMQSWQHVGNSNVALQNYKKKFKANPIIYTFDLAGYGTMQFPQDKVIAMAGFSDKIFDLMPLLEQDKNALLNEIKKVTL